MEKITDNRTKSYEQLLDEVEQLQHENVHLKYQQYQNQERIERNRHLLKYLSDYIYTVKVFNGVVVETIHGTGCFSVTGYNSEDYQNNPSLWYNMVHQDDRDIVTEQSQKALRGEDVPELSHRIVHRDGSVKWVKNTIVINRNKDGHVTHFYGLINDITELKKAEQLAEIKNEQLLQADKMATIGILASGIAHEINNPNNFVLLNTELFKKFWADTSIILQDYYNENGDFALGGIPYTEASEKVDELLQGLEKGSKRIQLIVNRLKEFTGTVPGNEKEPVDVKTVIENARLITGNIIKNNTNYFKLKIDSKIPKFIGHPVLLEQVLINLITNACQSLPDKSKKIFLTASFDQAQNSVIISVKDEGRGIEKENLKYIFNPFFTTKRNDGGTGLGLSISYNIIKNHNGKLEYESEPGKGTTARVIIPV